MKNNFFIIDIIIIIVIAILAIIMSRYSQFYINEAQLMYLSSTGAQVIATLFGLIITGYIFFCDRLSVAVEKDETLYDVTMLLKNNYNKRIIIIGIYSFLTILFCILNIVLGTEHILMNVIINNILLNGSILFIILTVFYIVIFVISVIDPNKIEKMSSKAQKELSEDNNSGDLSEFLKIYNDIEKSVKKLAGKDLNNQGDRSPSIIRLLDMLKGKKIIDENLLGEINGIRRYRNFVVHGTEMKVSKRDVETAKKLKRLLDESIKKYFNKK